MGCDISGHAERRINGAWEYVEIPHPTKLIRDYSLFSVLAGVRKDPADPQQRFWPQRRIPDDASEQLKAECELNDGADAFTLPMQFAHSYRTLAELQAHDWSRWPNFEQFLYWLMTLGEPNDVRFIFWFNN
jgi:hypothetical protein